MSVDRSVTPAVKDFESLNIEPARVLVSAHGIPVQIIEKGDDDVCMFTVLFPAGEMEAPSSEMMKILTSTWREGTTNYSADEIADKLDFYGAWMEISSSLHYTNITLYCLSSRLTELLPLLADITRNPLFSPEPVERIKTKMISALRISKDKVKTVAKENMKIQLLGSQHPLAIKESEDGFNAVTVDQLKEQHKKIITAKPSIVIAGKLNENIISEVTSFADTISKGDNSVPTLPNKVSVIADNENRIITSLMPEKEQSAVVMSFPAIVRSHPDYNDLRITVMLLGGYFGSRLMSNIREEKGYTYGITASLIGYKEIGYIAIECECDNSYVEGVITETKKELVRLADEPVSVEELETVKRMIKSSLASMMSDTFETAGYYVGQLSIGYPEDYFYSQQKSLDAITPERIMDIAKRYLDPDKMFISIAGGSDVNY